MNEGSAMNVRVFVAAALTVGFVSTDTLAHHSFSMFDNTKLQNVTGTVKEFEYINPHSWLHVATEGERSATWSFEMGGTGALTRDGWTRDTVKVGDKVTVSFHPLRDGSYGGQFRTVTIDGKVICQGGMGNTPCKADGGGGAGE